MEYIKWSEAYSLGIPSIDAQHKRLFRMLNEFYNNIGSNDKNKVIAELIANLKVYTLFHFKTEEKYMDFYNFIGYIAHKEEHRLFIEKVTELERKLRANELVLPLEVTNFLKDWLLKHVQGTDKHYAQFLIDRGVK